MENVCKAESKISAKLRQSLDKDLQLMAVSINTTISIEKKTIL